MATLKERKALYDFSLEDIRKLIADELKTSPDNVAVRYNLVASDDDRGGYPSYSVTDITVTVDE
jgi:hypothetical protein